jgi:hypothetical protein
MKRVENHYPQYYNPFPYLQNRNGPLIINTQPQPPSQHILSPQNIRYK